jgi:pimeloyl-ACP methyl ester carboxylesterase
MWSGVHEELSSSFDVISYDVRGAGWSPRAEGPHSPSDDLVTLLDALDIERVALVGSSMGSRIALELSAAHPERTSSAVLCSLALPEFATSDCNGLLPEFIRALTLQDLDEATELFTRMWFDGRRDPTSVDWTKRAAFVELVDLGFASSLIHQQWRTSDEVGPVEHLRTPTLFITGRDDWPDIHATAAALHRDMPNSSVVSLDSAAHTLTLDQPSMLLREIERFVTAHP